MRAFLLIFAVIWSGWIWLAWCAGEVFPPAAHISQPAALPPVPQSGPITAESTLVHIPLAEPKKDVANKALIPVRAAFRPTAVARPIAIAPAAPASANDGIKILPVSPTPAQLPDATPAEIAAQIQGMYEALRGFSVDSLYGHATLDPDVWRRMDEQARRVFMMKIVRFMRTRGHHGTVLLLNSLNRETMAVYDPVR